MGTPTQAIFAFQLKYLFLNFKMLLLLGWVFLAFFWGEGTPVACGISQTRGLIRAIAAGQSHSHSNIGSESHLPPTPQQCQILNPQSEARDWTHILVPSQIRFHCATDGNSQDIIIMNIIIYSPY